jgi:hypothetical protein
MIKKIFKVPTFFVCLPFNLARFSLATATLLAIYTHEMMKKKAAIKAQRKTASLLFIAHSFPRRNPEYCQRNVQVMQRYGDAYVEENGCLESLADNLKKRRN